MAARNQVYKCERCGNIVAVTDVGGGTLSCCGQPMTLLVENTQDAAVEKHVPFIVSADGELVVRVGEVAHPMVAEHYISWIEVVFENGANRKYLTPGGEPEARFCLPSGPYTVRAYCNLHGLWKK